MKKILLLGASGLIAPHITEGLSKYFELRLADVKPHPEGRRVRTVDVRDYEQVRDAARGVDAIMNFTVNRPDPVLSFHVNTIGAFNVMKAAVEHGIKRILHTGPELIIGQYQHEFDIGEVPQTPGTGYYGVTKYLSNEICKVYARAYGVETIVYQFNGLRGKPEALVNGDFPPFTIVWSDLVEACRIAMEIESVPDGYQAFILHSHLSQGKYSVEKARCLLGYAPRENVERFYRRKP